MELNFDTEPIVALDAITGIRTRPEMYLGPLDSLFAINQLLVEALCLALDNALSGCASRVDITVREDGSVTIRDNGPGPDVDIIQDGMTAIELLLTQVLACRKMKRIELNHDLCRLGIVATNALSRQLQIEVVQDGWLWRQRYSCGKALGPIQRIEPSREQWEQITFTPDPKFFGSRFLCAEYFAEWFRQQKFDLGTTAVVLHHANTTRDLTAC